MRAIVRRQNRICFENIENPSLQASTDAIVKVIYSSICTSDIHILKNGVPAKLIYIANV